MPASLNSVNEKILPPARAGYSHLPTIGNRPVPDTIPQTEPTGPSVCHIPSRLSMLPIASPRLALANRSCSPLCTFSCCKVQLSCSLFQSRPECIPTHPLAGHSPAPGLLTPSPGPMQGSRVPGKTEERNHSLASGTQGTANHTSRATSLLCDLGQVSDPLQPPPIQGPYHLQMTSFPCPQSPLLLATPCTLSPCENDPLAFKVTNSRAPGLLHPPPFSFLTPVRCDQAFVGTPAG